MAYETIAQTAKGTSTSTFGANDTNGNSIIVVIGSVGSVGNVTGVTDGEGNHYTKSFAVANATLTGEVEVWYASGIIGGTTNVITPAFTSAVDPCIIAREYWGLVNQVVINSNFFDQTAFTTGNSAAPSSGATGLLTQPYELVIGAAVAGTSPSFTLGAGFSNLATQAAALVTTIATEDMMVTSKSPVTATFGITSGQWACGVATFYLAPTGTTTSTSFTTSTSISSTSVSSTSTSISTTSKSTSTSSTSTSQSSTSSSISSTSSSISSTSISSTSSSTSISSTSTSISSTSTSSTSTSSTSSSTSQSSTSTSFSSTSSSISSTSSSVSSTSVSSTSSSSSTSTTTLPPLYLDDTYQDMVPFTAVGGVQTTSGGNTIITFNSSGTLVCTGQMPNASVLLVGGGGGGGGYTNVGGGGGGSGAAISKTITLQGIMPVNVGAGGFGGSGGSNGTNGSSSLFGGLVAIGGGFGANDAASTAGGNGGSGGGGGDGGAGGTGSVGFNGGASAGPGPDSGGGGGMGAVGVAGSNEGGGNGGNGISSSISGSAVTYAGGGGGGDAALPSQGEGGSGGGGNGATFGGGAATAGTANTGGGGGGGSNGNAAGANGGSGVVIISFPTPTSFVTNQDLINPFTIPNYSDVSTGDSDYFVQTGSQYVIAQYKQIAQTNQNNIQVTWRGRTTLAPSQSPVLLQVYNQNTSAWETWASQTVIPADTDFQITANSVSNALDATTAHYYDAQNRVSVRVYQQVV